MSCILFFFDRKLRSQTQIPASEALVDNKSMHFVRATPGLHSSSDPTLDYAEVIVRPRVLTHI
jgi:hypothetical protein